MSLPTSPSLPTVPVPNLIGTALFTASNTNNVSVILGQQDSMGASWVLNDIQGYWMSPPIVTATSQLGFNDRMAATTKFPRTGRPVTLMGTCMTQSITDLFAARQRLLDAWGDPNSVFNLIVTEPDVYKMLTQCRLNGQIDVSWMPGNPLGGWYDFNFSIPIIALDPAKYSLVPQTGISAPFGIGNYYLTFPLTFPKTTTHPSTQPAFVFQQNISASGAVTINNAGNLESYPLITITGSLGSGWYIQNATTGDQFTVNIPVPTGSSLVIDMLNRLVYLNGVIVNSQVQGTWFSCHKGINNIQLIASTFVGALMYVQSYSAWR